MDAKYVPIDDVAEYFSVSISTIRAWLRQGRIPKRTYIKVGYTYRFCIPEISEALTHRDEVSEETHDKISEEVGGEVISHGAARREEALLSARAPKDASQVINFDSLDEDQ
jgi:excisionase family DNA binding protein